MAFSSNSGGGPMADINVTPLVDVMLVLLIIFMITAPLMSHKIKVHHAGPTSIRCVTHKDVDSEDIHRALDAFREITAAWR